MSRARQTLKRGRPDHEHNGDHKLQVVHVGIVGDYPGGMAQVVREYLSWQYDLVKVTGWPTASRKRDPWSPFRTLIALIRLIGYRLAQRRVVFVVHMSQRGSFIREGLFVRITRRLGFRVAIHLHGSEFVSFANANEHLVFSVMSNAETIFTLTEESSDTITRIFAGTTNCPRIVRVPNAVTIPEELPTKDRIVLMAGELGERKGTDTLLEAWSSVNMDFPGWTLVLVGPDSGGFATKLQRIKSVTYLGPRPRKYVLELEATAAIAVLPSRHEALPMFLIESMARCCAIVATPVGQVRELVGNGGLLVEPGDNAGLAETLRSLMQSEVRRVKLGVQGRDRIIARYSEDVVKVLLEYEWRALERAGYGGTPELLAGNGERRP